MNDIDKDSFKIGIAVAILVVGTWLGLWGLFSTSYVQDVIKPIDKLAQDLYEPFNMTKTNESFNDR